MSATQGEEDLTEDKFYGELDNIMMWCFTLGFNAARREYGDQYKSAKEAEPYYEDNLDSWIQDIITSHEELLTKARSEGAARQFAKDQDEIDIVSRLDEQLHSVADTNGNVWYRYDTGREITQIERIEFLTTQLKKG